jgi:peptidylprolyl isomerase
MSKTTEIRKIVVGAIAFALLTSSVGQFSVISQASAAPADKKSPPAKEKVVTTKSGLKYVELKEGAGKEAKLGSTVKVHYTGTFENGEKFDSSVDRNEPFPVTIGKTAVIKGWTEGLQGIKAGGKRKLIIPPDLAYGPKGRGPIPANSTLIFEVEVLEVD